MGYRSPRTRGLCQGLVVWILVVGVLSLSQLSRCALRPLGRRQIVGLVKGEVASQRVAHLVKMRGIDFDPNASFLQELQKDGAKPILIEALREAKPIVRGVPVAPRHVRPALYHPPAPVQEQPPPLPPEARLYAVRYAEAQEAFRSGQKFFAERQWLKTENEMRQALALDPRNLIAHYDLAVALSQERKWQGAIAEYRWVLHIDPSSPQARYNLGIALEKENENNMALAQLRQAQALNPNDEKVAYALGALLSKTDDWSGAESEFRSAVRLAPASSDAYCALGLALLHENNVEGAIAQLQQALHLNPQNASAHDGLGTALLRRGNSVAAQEQFRVAAALRAVLNKPAE